MMFLYISQFILLQYLLNKGGDKKLKLDEKCVNVEAKDPRNLHDISIISKSSSK